MSNTCYHCGQSLLKETILFDKKNFCCQGCKSVYEILNLNDLTNFYELNKRSGVRPETETSSFDFLDTETVFNKVVDFSEGNLSLVTFKIPVIHCSSCIWLLESLQDLNKNIKYSTVHFTKKTVQISFNHELLKLSDLAYLLTNLGYKPVINLETGDAKEQSIDRSLVIKMAIAGFAFGNAMLFTLPEYFGYHDIWLENYKPLFRFISLLLAIPVVFYSASGYYQSAWFGLKNKIINIDVPIVLGILVLFVRSVFEVVTHYGSGYFDTLCGLLFFMLLGKIFQQKTYHALSYDRDYKSFYPIAVTKVDFDGIQENILLSDIKIGDRILVRNQEIIPVDSILINGEGNIDNSFITGESAPISKKPGDKIFAGGKQSGAVLELEVIKNVNQSYLTQLWNKEAFKKHENGLDNLVNSISKHFTIIILAITFLAAMYWYFTDFAKMFQVISAILIVACPCALALSTPFTMGHILRILGKNQMYVKDAFSVEKLSKIDTLVFDKTGTITYNKKSSIQFLGENLSTFDAKNIKTLVKNSTHPLSKALYDDLAETDDYFPIENFKETAGKGYEALVRNHLYRIGSATFCNENSVQLETAVYIKKDETLVGKFIFKNEYREGLEKMMERLGDYEIHILSGDNASEQNVLKKLMPTKVAMSFNQSPESKLDYIKNLQSQNKKVAMLGDGLNDAGALKQSNIGIAIAENTNTFTPSSDVIFNGAVLTDFPKYLALTKDAMTVVKITFGISFLYNIVGLSFAVSGNLSPLVAAILMPISSITVVAFTSLATWFRARKYFS